MSRVPPARSTRLGTTTPKGRNPPGPLALGMPRSGQRRSTALLTRSPDGGGGRRAQGGPDAPHARPLRPRGGRGGAGEEDGRPRRGNLRTRRGPEGERGPRGTTPPPPARG